MATSSVTTKTRNDAILEVHVTFPAREMAVETAKFLVAARLAACAQIFGDIFSIYRWEGKIETSDEVLLVLKTRADLFDSLATEIKAKHGYENPEIIAFEAVKGSFSYIDWIRKETYHGNKIS